MKHRGGAFTILELLVAMAVLCILVVMLFGMVDATTKLWRQNENDVDSYREARAALSVITDELRTMLPSTDTNYFSTNFVGTIPSQGVDGKALFFLTSLPSSAQPTNNKSDVCAVGYYLRWAKQNSGFAAADVGGLTTNGFQLFRGFYGSDITYSNIVAGKPPLTDLAQPTAAGVPQPEILARNICDLQVLCYATNGSGKLQTWTYNTNNPLPQVIEVRLTAINDELAKKLAGDQSRWTTNNAQVAASMHTFVSRIQVPQPNVQP